MTNPKFFTCTFILLLLILPKDIIWSQIPINSWSQLDNVRNNLSGNYVLTTNLNASSPGYLGIGDNWTPIANFTGSFDGDGYTVSDLIINTTAAQVGFFGSANNAAISNFTISNADVTGSHEIGIMFGKTSGSTTVTNCHVSGKVLSTRTGVAAADAGGLVGYAVPINISESSAYVEVIAQGRNVGGFVGDAAGGNYSKCFATGSATSTGNQQVGGFAGLARPATMNDCFALGAAQQGTSTNVGASRGVGGFIGRLSDDNSPNVSNCYSIGKATGGSADRGGFIGVRNTGVSVSNCYWDETTSGTTTAVSDGVSTGITGKTTAHMKIQSNFTGWNFSGVWVMSSQLTFNGYPALGFSNAVSQAPTSNQIATLANLLWVMEDASRWSGNYTQTADINAIFITGWDGNPTSTIAYSPRGATPIGNTATNFTGTYNGNGHTISNLLIERPTTDKIGLFGETDGATITKLGLVDPSISGGNLVGGLIGISTGGGTISECFVRGGSVIGNNSSPDGFIGGLIGRDFGGATISDVYTNTTVSNAVNAAPAAGLIGQYDGSTINRAYVAGPVHPNAVSPDFPLPATVNRRAIGQQSGASCNDCYFDATQNSDVIPGQSTAKTTAQMQQQATFTNWDFQCESTNGTDDIWGINEGNHYPVLSVFGYNQDCCLSSFAEQPTLDNGVYQIANFKHLRWVSENPSSWGADFIQTADIDAFITAESCYNGAEGWSPIGNTATNFTGTYNGNSHTISNIFMNRPTTDNVGLFGKSNGATISDLGLNQININGKNRVGGLVGDAIGGIFSKVYMNGFVHGGADAIGGLVGHTTSATIIEKSFTIGAVTGSGVSTAGFVGGNLGKIENCYSLAAVTVGGTDNRIGGLVGHNFGSGAQIINSYSTGAVAATNGGGLVGLSNNGATISNSFWDNQTSGKSTSAGGSAKTTTQMQQQATFTNWDFQCETINGTDAIWGIDEGNDYPRLTWEGFVQDCSGTWLGTISNDWNTSGNWDALQVPVANASIIIDPAAQNDLVLDQNRTVGDIVFNSANKKISLGDHNLIVEGEVIGADATNYIQTTGIGVVKTTIVTNTTFTFPIGNDYYNPLTITNKNTNDDFTARVFDDVLLNGLSGPSVSTPYVAVTWDIEKTNPNNTTGVDFGFQWDTAQEFGGITTFHLNHHNGNNWEIASGVSNAASGSGIKTMTHTGYTGSFSPFALGNNSSSALPVEFLGMQYECLDKNGVALTWQTASEMNAQHFEVMRSEDGFNWEKVGQVDASGTTSSLSEYTFVDQLPARNAVRYYQLKQVDFNGDYEWLPIISVNCEVDDAIRLYPNPTSDKAFLSIPSDNVQNIHIQLMDQTGRIINHWEHKLTPGNNILEIDVTPLQNGIYTILYSNNNKQQPLKMIINK